MTPIARAAAAIAAVLVREGVDYAQSKAVFKPPGRELACRLRPRAAAAWTGSRSKRKCAFSTKPTPKTAGPG